MKKVFALTLFALLFLGTTITQVDFVTAEKYVPEKYAPDQLLVKFKKDVSKTKQKTILDENEAVTIDEIEQIKVKVIKVPEASLEKVESALQNNNNVEYVEKDYLLEPAVIPDDPYFSYQWHLSKIQAPGAWDVSKGSSSVRIAILDTGVDPTHPDLAGKLVSGYNFYNNNNNWSDVCGHGTKVAGAAAAITNNAAGLAGVAWENPIIPIRITDTNCWGYYSSMINGIVYSADNGARVANISFRIFDGSALNDAARYMYNNGGWVVAAGGNTGVFENYSENPYIISVSATYSSDNITSFSSSGPYIDFAAPGSGIYTTVNGGTYGAVSGTSFSSPITAGLVSLLFSANPSLTSSQVYEILKTSSVDLGEQGYDQNFGWGRIDAAAALSQVSSPPPPPPEPTPEPSPEPTSVTITSPNDGSIVNGKETISISVSGFNSPTVTLFLDGNVLGTLTNEPYEYGWHTKGLSGGTHTITAEAIDSVGNNDSDSISIQIPDKTKGNGRGHGKR